MVVHAAAAAAARGTAAAGRVVRNGVRAARVNRRSTRRNDNEEIQLHPTIDREFRTRYERPHAQGTTSDDRRNVQKSIRRRSAPSRIRRTRTLPGKLRGSSRNQRGVITSAKHTASATVVAAYIAGSCSLLFLVQLSFWLVSVLGLAIEQDLISAAELLGMSFWLSWLALPLDAASALMSWLGVGYALFAVGWVVSMVLGLFQLAVTYLGFMARGINPLREEMWPAFGAALALYMLPFMGFFMWSTIWMMSVIWNQHKK